MSPGVDTHTHNVNSHHTRKGNAWKFVKTLHVKFFPLARKWPARMVTVKRDSEAVFPEFHDTESLFSKLKCFLF